MVLNYHYLYFQQSTLHLNTTHNYYWVLDVFSHEKNHAWNAIVPLQLYCIKLYKGYQNEFHTARTLA